LEISDGHYEIFYNHCDSYPTELGVDLAELLKAGKTADEIVKALELRDYQKVIAGTFGNDVAKQVYLGLQSDLEWVYVVDFNPRSLQVFRTSNPDLIHGPDFVFSVWFSYVDYFPQDIKGEMEKVQDTAEITLNGISAYHEASKKSSV